MLRTQLMKTNYSYLQQKHNLSFNKQKKNQFTSIQKQKQGSKIFHFEAKQTESQVQTSEKDLSEKLAGENIAGEKVSKLEEYVSKLNGADIVLKGIELIREAEYKQALRLYEIARRKVKLNNDESQALTYNSACAYAKLKQYDKASTQLLESINLYKLNTKLAQKDDDLAQFRETKEWTRLMSKVSDFNKDYYNDLRSEARSPFRFLKIGIFISLGLGSLLGLIIILTQLVKALQGGEGAPELKQTLINLGVNSTASLVLFFLARREIQQKREDVARIEKEESLGRLQVKYQGSDSASLKTLRGSVRPLVIMGNKEYMIEAFRVADQRYQELKERGIAIVPVLIKDKEYQQKLLSVKEEIQGKGRKKGFGKAEVVQKDNKAFDWSKISKYSTQDKWIIQPSEITNWLEWADGLKRQGRLKDDFNCYIQVQLDGFVKSSGIGNPNFNTIIDTLPPLKDVRTMFTDGLITK